MTEVAGFFTAESVTDEEGRAEHWRAWRKRREDRLSSEFGWLTLFSFDWLDWVAGPVRDFPGVFQVLSPDGGGDDFVRITFEEEDGVSKDGVPFVGTVDIHLDNEESDFSLDGGRWQAEIARRSNRYLIRVRRSDHPLRRKFSGVPTYTYSPRWIRKGRIVKRETPEVVLRDTARNDVVGEATIVADLYLSDGAGNETRLALEGNLDGTLELIFTDETSGTETADWRFLSIPSPWANEENPPEGDEANHELDFNFALNFPAAFTPYATCPKPLQGNHIPAPIRGGERRVTQKTWETA